MAIKILITLEGSEQVKSALDGMSRSGEAFMRQISGIGGAGTSPLRDLGDGFTKLTPSIAGAREATRGFHELMLVMNPILRTAGVELSAFAGFSRLASVGIGGLAVAISTGIIVALSKLADSVAVTQKRFETLLNTKPGTGAGAMAGLQSDAAKLGSTASTVQPIIEKFTSALQKVNAATGAVWVAPPGESLPAILAKEAKQAEPAVLALLAAIRSGGATEAQATQEATKFGDALRRVGKVNGEVIGTLDPFGGAIRAIGEALGLSGLNAEQLADRLNKSPRSIENLYKGLARLKPVLDKAFDDSPITAFDDALGRVATNWSNLWREFSSSKFAVGFLGVIAKMPEDFKAAINAMKKDWEDFQAWIKKLKLTDFLPEAQLFGNIRTSSQLAIDLGIQDLEKLGTANQQAAQLAWSGWDNVSASIMQLADDAVAAGNRMLQRWQEVQSKVKWVMPTGGAPQGSGWVIPPIKEGTDDLVKIGEQSAKIRTETVGIADGWAKVAQQIESSGNEIFALGQKMLWRFEGEQGPLVLKPPPSPSPLSPLPESPMQQQGLVAPFQSADEQIRTIWMDLMDYIATALGNIDLSTLTAALVKPFSDAVPLIRDELVKVSTMILEIMRQAAAAAGMIEQLNQGGRPGGGGGGFAFQEVAGGGYIRGPGTTTSDSIPAWLSNREYVIRAKAVDHYGANLFAALNSMRLPKDLFSHFAVGGLANALARTMPRYAAGGLATASAGRSLTIVLDGQRFGVSGSSDVIDRLERVATMAGIASVGRPPGWVR